jgi:hypothetical protein
MNIVLAAKHARDIAYRKTIQQIPWPECVVERRKEFEFQVARAFCDLVLPSGWSQLSDFPASEGEVNP